MTTGNAIFDWTSQSTPSVVENQLETWGGVNFFETWLLNEVVSQKFFNGLPLKLNSAIFGDISSNRKLTLKSPRHRKWETEIIIFVSDWRFINTINHLIYPITCLFLEIKPRGCREPARMVGGKLSRMVTVKYIHLDAPNEDVILQWNPQDTQPM